MNLHNVYLPMSVYFKHVYSGIQISSWESLVYCMNVFFMYVTEPLLFISPPPAVQVHVLKGDKAGEWWKFTVNIISVYKQGEHRIRRGDQLLWVRAKDVACKCPKIKPGRKYLLLGTDDDSPGQSGVVADKGSLLIPWKDLWGRRLRKFQQRDKRGKC